MVVNPSIMHSQIIIYRKNFRIEKNNIKITELKKNETRVNNYLSKLTCINCSELLQELHSQLYSFFLRIMSWLENPHKNKHDPVIYKQHKMYN